MDPVSDQGSTALVAPPESAAVPPQTPADPPATGPGRAVVVAVVVAVLLAVGAGTWFLSVRNPVPRPAPHPPAAASSPAASPSTATSPEQDALNELEGLRDASLAWIQLDGRWVAQVASRSVGSTDPEVTAANGTHTFQADDIVRETWAVDAALNGAGTVWVLWGTDFGAKATAPDGSPLWTTLVDAGFRSADDVNAWCATTYPGLTPDQLAHRCARVQLTGPHG